MGSRGGWTLTASYIEWDTRSSPNRPALWLVRGGDRKVLVPAGAAYRPEVEESFFEVTPGAAGTYSAVDALGSTHTFARLFGARAYLTRVQDLDGNVVEFAYDSDKEDPVRIQYNNYGSSTAWSFAAKVALEYVAASDIPTAAVAGIVSDRKWRLSRVRVNAPAERTIRVYEVQYTAPGPAGTKSVQSITEYGGDFAAALPPTVFSYDVSGFAFDYTGVVAPPDISALPPPVEPLPYGDRKGEWMDLDGDGKADLVWTQWLRSGWLYWARNKTATGTAVPIFEPARAVSLPAWAGSDPVRHVVLDFDGDGVMDVLRASASNGVNYHDIYRGSATGSAFTLDQVPVHIVTPFQPELINGTLWVPVVTSATQRLVDINGDGVLDYAWTDPSGWITAIPSQWVPGTVVSTWTYWLTSFYPAYRTAELVRQARTLNAVPGGQWFASPIQAWIGMDFNGDGLADAVWDEGYETGFVSAHNHVVGTTGNWRVRLNDGVSTALGSAAYWPESPWGASADLAGYGDSPSVTQQGTSLDDYSCGWATFDDTRTVIGDLVDLNGDGRPDFYARRAVAWNTGRGFAATTGVAGGLDAARYDHYATADWTVGCSTPAGFFTCSCGALLSAPLRGQFADLNGDGIPDFVHTLSTTPPAWLGYYRGATGNGIARPMVLRRIDTPDGAAYQIDYAPSSVFGAPARSRRPVVTKLGVSGGFVQSNSTYYWYAGPTSAPAWYDPVKQDDRGFAESWSQDEVTRIVRHTRWKTGSHALIGRPEMVETGVTAGSALATPASTTSPGAAPSGVTWFAIQSLAYGVRNLGAVSGADCASTGPPAEEPTAATYPLRVIPKSASQSRFHGSVEAKVTTTIACADVDNYGNVKKTTVTPSLGGVPGKVLVTTQSFGSALSACKNVFSWIRATRSDSANPLSDETRLYDSSCRLVEQYAGTATEKTNRTTYTYAGPFGLMNTSTTGGVTRSLTYDQFALNVAEERSDDGRTALSTTYSYDSATSLRLSFSGPRVVKKGGANFNGPAGITRYYLYDDFGRTRAVAKSPFTSGQANGAVEAYEYHDTTTPRSVVSYRFSVAKTYSMTSPIPSTDDAAKSIAYRDGLGRVIQVRERLGGGGAADAAVRVTQTLGGYRVAKAVLLDGAGRESVSLEPFYDAGQAFVDYRTAAIPATRGSVTTFDAQGRPWCSTHQYVSGTAPSPATSCYSDSSHSSSYKLATETRYGSRAVSGRGPYSGTFVSVEVYPPDQNVSGGAMKPTVKLLGPSGEELGIIDGEENRTWVERDAMGREVYSWRESGPRYAALSTPYPASVIVYNLAGQVVENWDANSTKVTRKSRYDEAGRLVYVTTDPATTTEGIEYVYNPGDLGRVSEVREVTYPTVGGAASVKRVALNHYDVPYSSSDPGYSYVAGKLAWTENGDTTIAYGYDDAGRVSRRDQWFARLDLTKRFTVSSTYGSDGRVLDSRVVNPYSATAEYQYFVDYDSAGRPVALSGKLASQTLLTKVYEVIASQGPSNVYGGYDALGRVPLMRADGGKAVSARRYNGYSGALEGECKRFGDAVACGTVSGSVFGAPPALAVAKDIYRSDLVAASYQGAKLASYEDSGAATRYTNTYLPNGRLWTSKAAPTGTLGSLTQDWLEAFLFNGIGNIDRVEGQRNAASGNSRPDRYETERYLPESPAPGQALDRVSAVVSRLSATSGGTVITGTAAASPGSTSYSYDLLGHLTKVTRTAGESETLVYAPGGELLYRQVGEKFTFYVGEYATVTAKGAAGCGASCVPQASTVEVDAHVVFAGTRIASVKPSRTLYYYRTRLGTVVATSLGGGVAGAGYRYTPYGDVELTVNETDLTRSELGYTNALRLTGSLLYLRNRVYDAEARVFIQPDTVDRLRYAYVMGDPVNLNDPTGLLADVDVPPGPLQTQEWSVRIVCAFPLQTPDRSAVPNDAPVSGETVAQQVNGIAMQFEKLKTDIGAALPGTGAGEYALKFYIGIINDSKAGTLEKGAAYVGAAFASLWTKETAVDTALTLGAAAIANDALKAAATATDAGMRVAGEAAKTVAGDPRAGGYAPPEPLPKNASGQPAPDQRAGGAHTQLGTKESARGETYRQAREWSAEGKRVRDVDFTDHGRRDHPNPHQHVMDPTTGKRGDPEKLP